MRPDLLVPLVTVLALLCLPGCGDKPRAAQGLNPDLARAEKPAAAAVSAPAARNRLAIKVPRSQQEIDAIYRAEAGSSVPRRSVASLPPPKPAPVEPVEDFRVVADPSWDVNISREWRHIVIHHSAGTTGSAAAFDRAHRERGWDGLGYHFVIGNGTLSGDGEVETGYRWRRQMPGAHAGNAEYNQHGIGICLVGDFEHNARPTPRQMASLRQLVRYLQVKTGVPTCEVIGHGDVPGKSTACPGNLNMNAFRASLGGNAIGVPVHFTRAPAPASTPVARTANRGAALP